MLPLRCCPSTVDDMPSDISIPGAEELWTLTADERHERLLCLCKQIYDKFVAFKYNDSTASTSRSDLVVEYSVQLLRMGCFYMEFVDAIREGDGGRVLRCWKYKWLLCFQILEIGIMHVRQLTF